MRDLSNVILVLVERFGDQKNSRFVYFDARSRRPALLYFGAFPAPLLISESVSRK